MMKRERHDRQRTLRVVVSARERAQIEERAMIAGLSVSAYLRAAELHQPIRSVLDHQAICDLAKVNGDQGQLREAVPPTMLLVYPKAEPLPSGA